MSKKILVDLGFNPDYEKLVKEIYNDDIKIVTIDNFLWEEKYDLILMTGGHDVDPKYYNENVGSFTSINTKRDKKEIPILQELLYSRTPKLGICRGSQLLCALNGGKVIQHVENHISPHNITIDHPNIKRNMEIKVTSTHHQMMYPFCLNNSKYKLIAWSTYFNSNVYLDGNNKQIEVPTNFLEPEIVEFPSTNSLAIQCHPEFPNFEEKSKEVIIKLIRTILNLNI